MRLDIYLINHEFAQSREKAKYLIESGFVQINGKIIKKSSYKVKEGEIVALTKKMPYVSRAGLKLKAALDVFKVDVKDMICLDIGSSTGGFTDCLLQEGAAKVYAVDVGTGQLHESLKTNKKVISYEGMDIRNFDISNIKEPLDIIVVDVSFISVRFIVDVLPKFTNRNTKIIILFKPQFEVGRAFLKKGIVVSREQANRAFDDIQKQFVDKGFIVKQSMKSPVKGKEGNQEYLLYVLAGNHLEK